MVLVGCGDIVSVPGGFEGCVEVPLTHLQLETLFMTYLLEFSIERDLGAVEELRAYHRASGLSHCRALGFPCGVSAKV